ncbi:leucyl aminopeptidase [Jatrophihabitans sp. GAS493]|uniref:leucyl aminopeptidase family protein n=1 Tax=Jatrophihabitans sp. GAS493 TaxID=1907575 RepID=UPI000BBFD9DD|nr:leucyl aminopeptidase family protein [Jatrophihabitans sp. GAS493]SOD75106.1 leucyl aminopeptidase [Jatrophihabitans sp. GAS493]
MIDIRLGDRRTPADVVAVVVSYAGLGFDVAGEDLVSTQVLPISTRDLLRVFIAETDAESAAEHRPESTTGSGDASGLAEAGVITELLRPAEVPRRILLVGVSDGGTRAARLAGAAVARNAASTAVSCVLAGLDDEAAAAFAEGLQLGAYRFGSPTKRDEPQLQRAALFGAGSGASLDVANHYARAGLWARDLTNTRTNTKSPAWLGAQAEKELGRLGVAVTVRDDTWLREQGFGGVIGVGQGSASPPRLIEAGWRPRGAPAQPHIVLVGKGITFDTGGYNLKPGSSMTTMYTDMAGGAAVLAAVHVVASLQLPIRVTALVPAAENSVSGNAMRPGDVLRHYNGRTSEITNTDAEGRLVLADALSYAVAKLQPAVLVDIATLTGAMKMALGDQIAGVVTDDDDLAKRLDVAAETVDEPLWRMPLNRDYESLLDSPIADANNSPGAPGGITAALFLRHFVGDVPWAHLDIAGPARAAEAAGYVSEGSTGFGARLLARWIQDQV